MYMDICWKLHVEKKIVLQLLDVDKEISLPTYYIHVHIHTVWRDIRTSKPSNNGHLYAQEPVPSPLVCMVKCTCVALVWMRAGI